MKKPIYILFILFLFWNNQLRAQLQIEVKPTLDIHTINKDSLHYVVREDTFSVSTLRLYISEIQIFYNNGNVYNEPNSYHLLDLEYPASFHINLNTSNKEIQKISFNLGIDSVTSVSGALDGDLDPAKGMYWAWQSGYINLKIDGKYKGKSAKASSYSLHIGGYSNPNYALRKVTIPIQKIVASNLILTMDILKLLHHLDLSKDNNIMIPGKEAMRIADILSNIFSN